MYLTVCASVDSTPVKKKVCVPVGHVTSRNQVLSLNDKEGSEREPGDEVALTTF